VAEDQEVLNVRRAIFALEDDYREPLVMQVLLGHSTDEIAVELGLTRGAVLTRLFRARQKLRQMLGLPGARRNDPWIASNSGGRQARSGHLGPEATAHRDACPACAESLRRTLELDEKIFAALTVPAPSRARSGRMPCPSIPTTCAAARRASPVASSVSP